MASLEEMQRIFDEIGPPPGPIKLNSRMVERLRATLPAVQLSLLASPIPCWMRIEIEIDDTLPDHVMKVGEQVQYLGSTTPEEKKMTILPSKLAQTVLREWGEKGWNAGFFFWLEFLGRKDEEVKEMLYKPEDKIVYVTFNDGATEQAHIELRY